MDSPLLYVRPADDRGRSSAQREGDITFSRSSKAKAALLFPSPSEDSTQEWEEAKHKWSSGLQQLAGNTAQANGVKPGEQRVLCECEDAISIFQTPAPPGELCSESCLQDRARRRSALFPPPARGFGALGLRPENAQAAEEEVGRHSGGLMGGSGAPTCLSYSLYLRLVQVGSLEWQMPLFC